MQENIIKKYGVLKERIFSQPRKVFAYAMAVLILSLIFSILQYCFFPPNVTLGSAIPTLYSKSDKVKQNQDAKEKSMEKIVGELSAFKAKSSQQSLSEADSIRIEYLYNQYEKLKNGL